MSSGAASLVFALFLGPIKPDALQGEGNGTELPDGVDGKKEDKLPDGHHGQLSPSSPMGQASIVTRRSSALIPGGPANMLFALLGELFHCLPYG